MEMVFQVSRWNRNTFPTNDGYARNSIEAKFR